MASFDHWVRPLTADERVRQRSWFDGRESTLPTFCDYGQGQKRCSKPALYLTTYDYRGKHDRVTTCRRRMCLQHAAQFAKKHGCKCSKSGADLSDMTSAAMLNAVVERV